MALPPRHRRPKPVTLLILALTSVALAATSEVGPMVSSEASGRMVLSEGRPKRQLLLSVLIASESFSGPQPSGGIRVTFRAARGEVPPFGEAEILPVHVVYSAEVPPLDAEDAEGTNDCSVGGRAFCQKADDRRLPLSQCDAGQECRLSVPVIVEWTDPLPGAELILDWRGAANLAFDVGESAPPATRIIVEGSVH
jgi:hypothetical protein